MSEDRVVEFAAEYTDEELVEYGVWVQFSQPGQEEGAKNMRRSAVALALLAAFLTTLMLLILVVSVRTGWKGVNAKAASDILVTIAAAAVLIFALAWRTHAHGSRPRMKQVFTKRLLKANTRNHTNPSTASIKGMFRIDGNGLSYSDKGTTTTLQWASVNRIDDLDHGVGVHAGGRAMFLPKSSLSRAVGSDGYSYVHALAAKHSKTDEQVIVEYLETRDVMCVTCGYNLRGITAARCPECGAGLSQETVSQAFAKA